MYTCCIDNINNPPPPPMIDSLWSAHSEWSDWPFSLANSSGGIDASQHPFPSSIYDECLPPFCASFDSATGGSQPTKLVNGQTVPDCDLGGAGLAPHLAHLQKLYPCFELAEYRDAQLQVRNYSVADNAASSCTAADSYLAPSGHGELSSALRTALIPECTLPGMLPGSCVDSECWPDDSVAASSICAKSDGPFVEGLSPPAGHECLPAKCPMYGYFMFPLYQPFESVEALEAHVIRSQTAVRTRNGDVDLPSRPYGKVGLPPRQIREWDMATISSELEQLFPTFTFEFADLDLPKLRGTLRVSTWVSWWVYDYARMPRHWRQHDNETVEHETILRINDWEGLSNGKERYLPMLQMWWANAMLREGLGDASASIRTSTRSQPEFQKLPSTYASFPTEGMAGINALLVPLGTSFAMPLIAVILVSEKAGKQRSLMVMMGLKIRWYWLAEWLWNSFLTLLINLVFFVICAVGNVQFLVRSPAILLLMLLLWSQCVVAMAVLSSCLYRRVITASIGNYVFVFFSFLIASTIMGLAFRAAGDFPIPLALFAPFAYSRAFYLLLLSTYTISTMSAELSALLGMLALDAVLYFALGIYLDAVLPREFGVRSHPLFFLQPLKRLLLRTPRQIAVSKTHTTRRDVDIEEDEDVRRERELVERDERTLYAAGMASSSSSSSSSSAASAGEAQQEAAAGAPAASGTASGTAGGTTSSRLDEELLIISRSLRKVYSGGKVAVRNLTMSVKRGECFGFLGPNGAGKTTAISVWTGLYEPTSGERRRRGGGLSA